MLVGMTTEFAAITYPFTLLVVRNSCAYSKGVIFAFKLKERGIHTFFAGLLAGLIVIVHGRTGINFLGAVQSKQPSTSDLTVFDLDLSICI